MANINNFTPTPTVLRYSVAETLDYLIRRFDLSDPEPPQWATVIYWLQQITTNTYDVVAIKTAGTGSINVNGFSYDTLYKIVKTILLDLNVTLAGRTYQLQGRTTSFGTGNWTPIPVYNVTDLTKTLTLTFTATGLYFAPEAFAFNEYRVVITAGAGGDATLTGHFLGN